MSHLSDGLRLLISWIACEAQRFQLSKKTIAGVVCETRSFIFCDSS